MIFNTIPFLRVRQHSMLCGHAPYAHFKMAACYSPIRKHSTIISQGGSPDVSQKVDIIDKTRQEHDRSEPEINTSDDMNSMFTPSSVSETPSQKHFASLDAATQRKILSIQGFTPFHALQEETLDKLCATKSLAINLLPFQKQGVGWMVRKELTSHGGILADHLGLGKTVQMIALMIINPLKLMKTDRSFADEIIESAGSLSISKLQRMATVCRLLYKLPGIGDCSRLLQPEVNLFELALQIDDKVQELMHCGAERESEITQQCAARVQKWLDYTKRFYGNYEKKCDMFIQSSSHDIRVAGVDSLRPIQTEELRTLIVVPTSLLSQWHTELLRCVSQDHPIRVCTYHGAQREGLLAATLEQYDFVITTYDILWHEAREYLRALDSQSRQCHRAATSSEMRETMEDDRRAGDTMVFERAKCGPLFSIVWKRVVLDEAHVVRNQLTQRWKAVNQLLAVKRWCITATPMQNDLGDLQTLLRFVHSPPLPIPAKVDPSQLLRDRALQEAIARCLRDVVLRREPVMTRFVPVAVPQAGAKPQFVKERVSLLKLPPKIEHIELVTARAEEVDLYNSLVVRARKLSNRGTGGEVQYLVLLMRLRQVCCHPWLVAHVDLSASETICAECKGVVEAPVRLRCGHSMCRACATNVFEEAEERMRGVQPREYQNDLPFSARTMLQPVERPADALDGGPKCCELPSHGVLRLKCPVDDCDGVLHRRELTEKHTCESYRKAFRGREFVSSAKVDTFLGILRKIWKKAPGDKVVVFTHFVSFMAILEIALGREGIRHLSLSGSLAAPERASIVNSFYRDPTARVLLASKIACGAGLNLTVANHVIVLDPWWNPGIEEQAVHRCHRIGQTKPVHIYRCITEKSIEYMCWQIANKKKIVGDMVIQSTMEGAETTFSQEKSDALQKDLDADAIRKKQRKSMEKSASEKSDRSKIHGMLIQSLGLKL